MSELKEEVAVAAAKASPPVLAFWSGLTVHDLVGWMTVAYLALQTAHLLWKWRRAAQKARCEPSS
ncbi:hypothetical protein D0B54_18100 [Solimonas sp. K1W22B-7]|uniref:hypothetical protein n=1 Tax=Solimonas sp. K1W22B-7 TaxID=2303331 RepID=UPI000E330D11|nr:hypothetical protein [Solimonas sp. K1W22B-7]AXQ30472.1 hypothetical protein D0B54_18100 [Solimonas sp. K1W22B-7]